LEVMPFVNQVDSYNQLSEEFRKRLYGLKVIHSAAPIESEHPLVRTHPATGEKVLFVNKGCQYTMLISNNGGTLANDLDSGPKHYRT
jgi:hypothetical protein